MTKAKLPKYKSFENWMQQEVEREFSILQSFDVSNLAVYQDNLPILTEKERERTEELRQKLATMNPSWNEYDISIAFIGPLLNIIDFQFRAYRAFFNHSLQVEINGKTLGGKVDCMLAKGYQIPESPLFFIQEYKPQRNPSGDPLGQLLVEMVAAQVFNKEETKPLYGCYIIGSNWYFMMMKGSEYTVSSAYDAAKNEIFVIVAILKKIKALFEKEIGFNQ